VIIESCCRQMANLLILLRPGAAILAWPSEAAADGQSTPIVCWSRHSIRCCDKIGAGLAQQSTAVKVQPIVHGCAAGNSSEVSAI